MASVPSSAPGGASFRLRGLGLALLAACGLTACETMTKATSMVSQIMPGRDANVGPGVPVKFRPMFERGTANGADLYEMLKEIRLTLQKQRSVRAWTQAEIFSNRALDSALSGNSFGWDTVVGAATDAAIEELKSQLTTVSFALLEEHLKTLLGDDLRGALKEESISLPAAGKMTPAQVNRTVVMATLVIAAKLTAKVLDSAEKDFKALEPDYAALLEQREQAAKLLFTAIDARRSAQRSGNNSARASAEQSMRRSLSEQDLRFIDVALNTMTLTEFTKDMAAQNLALQYLRTQDPEAFATYTTKKKDVVLRTEAYLKAVSGVAAFSALSSNFIQSVAELGKERNISNIMSAMPLMVDFARVAVPTAYKVGNIAIAGVGFPDSLRPRNLYTVETQGSLKPVSNAKDVFKAIQDAGASQTFTSVFFSEDAQGWLNGVRGCDAAEAGRMIDATVPREDRTKFALAYFGPVAKDVAPEYAFVNAFTVPTLGEKEQRLPNALLGYDQRVKFRDKPISEVQLKVSERYGEWSNHQLLRLIFSNSKESSSVAYANMQLGMLTVKPVPSPEALFVYESYIDSCVNRDKKATPPPPPPPPQRSSGKSSAPAQSPAPAQKGNPPKATAPVGSAPKPAASVPAASAPKSK